MYSTYNDAKSVATTASASSGITLRVRYCTVVSVVIVSAGNSVNGACGQALTGSVNGQRELDHSGSGAAMPCSANRRASENRVCANAVSSNLANGALTSTNAGVSKLLLQPSLVRCVAGGGWPRHTKLNDKQSC